MTQLYLRPSAASRWLACPASAILSKDIQPTPSGNAAMAGTAIHALAESCYLFGADPMESVGKEVEGVLLAAWHCQMAQEHINEIKRIEEMVGQNSVRVEQAVTYCDTSDVLVRGTADVIGVNRETLIVADLKTGNGYVDEDNEQMKIYALGALSTMGIDWVKNVELRVIQPRHGAVRTHHMSIKELRQWEKKVLQPAIYDAINPPQTPKPSEKACQYCPAKLTCPAQQEAFAVIEAQPNVTTMTKEDIKAVMVTLTDEQVSDLLNRAPIVEAFIETLRKHALERMKGGGTLPGWQLAPKRATRKWADESKAKEALVNVGIDAEELYITEFITPAAADKLLGKEHRELIENLTVKESSGVTIARDASLRQ